MKTKAPTNSPGCHCRLIKGSAEELAGELVEHFLTLMEADWSNFKSLASESEERNGEANDSLGDQRRLCRSSIISRKESLGLGKDFSLLIDHDAKSPTRCEYCLTQLIE